MEGNYRKQEWYMNADKEDKVILQKLIEAQQAQDNMDELEPQKYNLDVAIKVVNKD